jgi:hypothetical protein
LPVLCVEVEPDVGDNELPGLHQELLTLAEDSDKANTIHAILFKRRLPVDPRHNSKIERPRLAKWAVRQLSGSRFRSRRGRPVGSLVQSRAGVLDEEQQVQRIRR